jgi:glycogen synthase
VTPTTAFRKQMAKEYGLQLQAQTIPNGRSADLFAPGPKEARILSAGRLWDEGKNLQLLDRVAPQVSLEIAIAGDSELQNARPFSGKSLRHLGTLDGPALARELSVSAIYAAPAYYEPFGLAILEAALSGCALVLSDLPTLRENWDGCARFIHPDDEAGWIQALNEVAANNVERQWLQSRARARAMTFSSARQVQAYLQLYSSLCEMSGTAPRRRIAFA